MSKAVVKVNGSHSVLPTGDKIRAGTKMLTNKLANLPCVRLVCTPP